MAPALSWLSACKASQLKAIATAIGLNSSGTKPVLSFQLRDHLLNGHLGNSKRKCISKDHFDIVSIDMGIRNLAYCRLKSPQPSKTPESNPPASKSCPVISEWARVEVSKTISKPATAEDARTKEAFDPATYSQHAYDLVHTLLSSSSQKPTQILIERQRFRSMGGSAVQEWTLRVNMFEAMIYAVLKTFSENNMWQGTVHPVAPAKVSKFWLGDKEGAAVEGKRSKSAKTKTAKVEVVRRWLKERDAGGSPFRLEGRAEEMGLAYLSKGNGGKRSSGKRMEGIGHGKESGGLEVGKLDDLADCMLQGMAWIKWEQNRRRIMAQGLKAMDDIRSIG